MKIDIIHEDGYAENLEIIKNSVSYFGNMLMSKRMCNTLNVYIELSSDELKGKTVGRCYGEDIGSKASKNFLIVVRTDRSLAKQLQTIAHEMVHVYQQSTNKLQRRKWKSDDKVHARWKGEEKGVIDEIPYLEQPWEKEAYALELPMINCFREHHHKRHEKEIEMKKVFVSAVKKFDFENQNESVLSY